MHCAARVAFAPLVPWLLLGLAAGGCDRVAVRPAPRVDGRPNVLLVSIDTLRADHLGCYGYARATSPRIDALAATSTRYAHALAPAPWTLPSHTAMLTGRHPWEIGVVDRFATVPPEVPIVSEYLAAAGYATAAFVDETARGWVGAERGFGRGFESYRHLPEEHDDHRYDAARTADSVIEWLEERDPSRPFFVFAHTKSVHALHTAHDTAGTPAYPYDKPRAYLERFATAEDLALQWRDPSLGIGVGYLNTVNQRVAIGAFDPAAFDPARRRALRALYDAGIYYVDEQVGRLLDALERLALRDDTVVIVTADHGEAFLEHRLLMHKEVYDPTLHVPLIVHVPGRKPSVETRRASLMDVVPIVLELAGVARPAELARADAADGEAFSFYRDSEGYYTEAYSLRGPEWTIVSQRLGPLDAPFRGELYRADDAGQTTPIEDRPDVLAAGLARLQQRLARTPERPAPPIELDAGTLEHLRALGYVDSAEGSD